MPAAPNPNSAANCAGVVGAPMPPVPAGTAVGTSTEELDVGPGVAVDVADDEVGAEEVGVGAADEVGVGLEYRTVANPA